MKILKDKGELPPPPKGMEFLLDDLENQVSIEIDPKYPQAVGTTVMNDVAETLYNSPWMRIFNKTGTPFLTSDNPACMWYPKPSDLGILYLPLSPTVAVLIKPKINSPEPFDHSTDEAGEAKPSFVPEMNEHVIKCASNLVISHERSETTRDVVSKLRGWRYDCVSHRVPMGTGFFLSIDQWRAVPAKADGSVGTIGD